MGLRLDLDGRAPLHRLHAVPGPAAAPDLPGRPDPPHPARHRRHRPAVARPGAAGGADHPARQPVRWAGPARHRPGHRQGRVRRLPGADGHLAPALPRVRRRRPARPGGRLRRARRRVHPAAPPRRAPAAPALLPRPHLRRRGLPGLHAAHGRARRRPAGDRPEAVGEGAGGLRRLPGDVGRGERGRAARPDLQRLPVRRRGRGAGRGARAPAHRRLLPLGPAPLRLRRGAARGRERLRVLRLDRPLHRPSRLGAARSRTS